MKIIQFLKISLNLDININKTKFLAKLKKMNNFFLGSNGNYKIKLYKRIPFIFGDFKYKSFFELKNAIDDQI